MARIPEPTDRLPRSLAGTARAALLVLLTILLAATLSGPSRADPLNDAAAYNPCRIAARSAMPDPACGWTFESIARIRTVALDRSEELANLGRLERVGFTTSELTIEESVSAIASGSGEFLSWDRETGIADQLTDSMHVAVDTTALSSSHFLLMPAAFNEAYLADFVDFTACATAYTFIFSGVLDGRSDAPYVTHRWQEMKVDVCLDIAGADCSRSELEVEPARLYFHGDWPCRYTPRRTSDGDGWSGS